ETMDRLESYKLVHRRGGLQRSYKTSYAGYTRLSRLQILEDRQVDALRVLGESDTLDYKRHVKIGSPTEKLEFAKDVVAFANGPGELKHILVGVNNDGTFHVPADPDHHRKLIELLNETMMQQIVSERTIQTPSIRLVARDEH